MVNFSECISAAVIRHKGENTFYIPMVIVGHDDVCLYPAFPESPEDEHFIKFYDELEDWEAFDLAEAQKIYREEEHAIGIAC